MMTEYQAVNNARLVIPENDYAKLRKALRQQKKEKNNNSDKKGNDKGPHTDKNTKHWELKKQSVRKMVSIFD